MKLTNTQEIVLNKLDDKWRSAYDLQCSLATLNKLVKLGLAETEKDLGSLFMPRVCKHFRKRGIKCQEVDQKVV